MARVYQTPSLGEALVRAAVVEHANEADLCVHRVSSWGLARGDALWYMTRDRQDATAYVYFDSPGASQLRVCFVDSETKAGWRRPHPLKGRLG